MLDSLTAGGQTLRFGDNVTHVMAVVNLSPESLVRQAVVDGADGALERARRAREFGASIIDLGAQSSHFENAALSPAEELDRLLPALEALVADGFVVSVDTWKSAVADAALDSGAAIVNDTGGLQDPRMVEVVASHGVPAVLMHIEGEHPLAVGDRDLSDGRPQQIADELGVRAAALRDQGAGALLVDPGLSINYRSDYEAYGRLQLATIRDLAVLRATGYPVVIPVPRKQQDHRMLSYLTLAIEYGADVIRVHDVDVACDLVGVLGRELGVAD